jgi:hypothetical protein
MRRKGIAGKTIVRRATRERQRRSKCKEEEGSARDVMDLDICSFDAIIIKCGL